MAYALQPTLSYMDWEMLEYLGRDRALLHKELYLFLDLFIGLCN